MGTQRAASILWACLFAMGLTPALAQTSGQEKTMQVYLTGYSYWDNTPPGSTAIARPVLHKGAGGKGTYADPITLAVGHKIVKGKQTLDFPPGTRFYLPKLKRYAIVEDVCGDGPTPQNGPCHIGKNGKSWIDIYVGGKTAGRAAANACMHAITGFQAAIKNPKPHYPVVSGALSESGCKTK